MAATFWDKRSEKYDADIREHDGLYNALIERSRKLLDEESAEH